MERRREEGWIYNLLSSGENCWIPGERPFVMARDYTVLGCHHGAYSMEPPFFFTHTGDLLN